MNTIQPDWPAPINIKAYTTVRQCWGENPSDDLKEKSLKSLLELPDDPIWLTQTHSATVVEATHDNIRCNADAAFTSMPNRICIVLTADCLPILICNKQGTCVAAIHAGWRGLANDIVEMTLEKLQQAPEDLLIWLGPAIGPQKFEVSDDVYTAFISKHHESAAAFTSHKPGKWYANLYHLAKIRLKRQGIQQVYGGQFCTYSQADLFFSYRRDKTHAGRMASLIYFS